MESFVSCTVDKKVYGPALNVSLRLTVGKESYKINLVSPRERVDDDAVSVCGRFLVSYVNKNINLGRERKACLPGKWHGLRVRYLGECRFGHSFVYAATTLQVRQLCGG